VVRAALHDAIPKIQRSRAGGEIPLSLHYPCVSDDAYRFTLGQGRDYRNLLYGKGRIFALLLKSGIGRNMTIDGG
jgi:hypothetical protein